MSEDMFWGVTALTWAAMIVQYLHFSMKLHFVGKCLMGLSEGVALLMKNEIQKMDKESENEQSE